ncbi:hypothetical protein LTR37_012949 [Vermiconidia calcicola]|uniref:Uncharacterized protein n=1 Tax=Vermiconidia calcicola TaxID=1690605 RepID=A0ACC3MZ28_9PEZI|nr:hypothetical protein LTR37_012949 [Vermiconidia calcicola]
MRAPLPPHFTFSAVPDYEGTCTLPAVHSPQPGFPESEDPHHPPTVASSNTILDTIYTTSKSLLGEDAARNISAALSHASRTLGTFFNLLKASTPALTPPTWQNTIYDSVNTFIASRTSLENTSLLLALCTFLFLAMSWTSRLGTNLGRFSPFTRSPTHAGGSAKVSDADFSYITADDLRRHQAESTPTSHPPRAESPPVDHGPPRDTDVLILRNKKKEYAVHFPAYSISNGELSVGTVRESAAKKTGAADARRVKLLYKGKNLKDDMRSCRQEGLRDGSEALCTMSESSANSVSGSDSDDTADGEDGLNGSAMQADGEPAKRKRNRGKRTKRRNRRDAPQDAGASGTSTPEHIGTYAPAQPPPQPQSHLGVPPPAQPGSPATPLDKLNALHATLGGFQREVENFMRCPPADQGKRDFEHKRLSEIILTQVLLKLDAVETEGDPDARQRRKDLVKETQRVMGELDAFMKG